MYSGCLTALVTPFHDDTTLDLKSLKRLLEYQHNAAADGFVACGSTGEAATLSDAEYCDVISFVKEHAAGKPVIAGINASSTARAVEISVLAKKAGADGLLLVSPPYNKPPQAGIIEHFRQVKKSAGLPLIAYNIPGRTGVSISAQSLGQLAEEGTIVAVKESSANLDTQLDILQAMAGKAVMLSGDDSYLLGLLANGATGLISATANIAVGQFTKICKAYAKGDVVEARKLHFEVLPIIRLAFLETNPIAVKYMLKVKGIINSAALRLPLVPLQAANMASIEKRFL